MRNNPVEEKLIGGGGGGDLSKWLSVHHICHTDRPNWS